VGVEVADQECRGRVCIVFQQELEGMTAIGDSMVDVDQCEEGRALLFDFQHDGCIAVQRMRVRKRYYAGVSKVPTDIGQNPTLSVNFSDRGEDLPLGVYDRPELFDAVGVFVGSGSVNAADPRFLNE
jgi:hypothetical protein